MTIGTWRWAGALPPMTGQKRWLSSKYSRQPSKVCTQPSCADRGDRPHDHHPLVIGKAVCYLSRGKLPAVAQGGFDWVDARDVGQGVRQALQLAPSGLHYLETGTWTSVLELAERISAITGCFRPRIAFPLWTAWLVVPVGDFVATHSRKEQVFTSATLGALDSNIHICRKKAEDELGYSPRPLDQNPARYH